MGHMNFVGIDVAINSREVTVDGSNESWNFPNNESVLEKLVKKMKKFSPCLIVLEATGGYESTVVASLQSKGFPLAVINPRQILGFARSVGLLAKTDILDAKVIANFSAKIQPAPRMLPNEAAKK